MKRNVLFLFSFLFLAITSVAQVAPAGVMAVQQNSSNAKILVTWTDPGAGESGFLVVIKNAANFTVDSTLKAVNATSHLTGALPSGTYSVVVSQFIAPSTYTPAAAVSAVIPTFIFGIHPLAVELAQTTNTRTVFTWDQAQSTGIDGFELVLTNLDAGTIETRDIGFVSSYQWNGLMGNTRYRAQIRPFKNNAGTRVVGFPQLSPVFTTKPNIPNPVNLELIKSCPAEIVLRIVPQGGVIEEYEIQKAFTMNGPWFNFGSTNNGSPFIVDGETSVNQGVGTVFYRVFARNVTGASISTPAAITVNKFAAPPAPINVVGTDVTANSTVFRWTNPAVDNACGTNLIADIGYQYTVNGGTPVTGGLFPGVQSLLIDGLTMLDTVKLDVWYWSPQGLKSNITSGTVRTLGPPDAPTSPFLFGFVDALGDVVIKINATDGSEDEEGFEFFIGTSPDIASLSLAGRTNFALGIGSPIEFFHKPLEEGVKYYYAVRAFNNFGPGNFSPVVTNDAANFTVAPASPFNLKATAGSGGVVLTWRDDSSREANFEIERAPGGTTTFAKIGEVGRNVLTYTDATATAGAAYSYRVIAVNTVGSSAPSNIASVGTVATPPSTSGIVGVFPNPTTDLLNINMPEKYNDTKGSLMLIDKNFREVYKAEINFKAEGNTLDLTRFPAGMYNVIIITEDYKFSKKVQRF